MINPLLKKHASQIACFHIQGISTGFISSLGVRFVTALYEAVAEDENSFGFVAIEDDRVVGFVAFTANLSCLYKFVIRKKIFRFGFILARKMLSLRTIKKVWANLFYPKKMKQMDLPDAELLSIVIAPEGRGKGIAGRLIEKSFEECKKRKFDKVKVLVAADNEAANKLYQKNGFNLVTQINSHGVLSNIYIAHV